MIQLRNKKHKIFFSAFAVVLVLGLVSGGVVLKGKMGGLKTRAIDNASNVANSAKIQISASKASKLAFYISGANGDPNPNGFKEMPEIDKPADETIKFITVRQLNRDGYDNISDVKIVITDQKMYFLVHSPKTNTLPGSWTKTTSLPMNIIGAGAAFGRDNFLGSDGSVYTTDNSGNLVLLGNIASALPSGITMANVTNFFVASKIKYPGKLRGEFFVVYKDPTSSLSDTTNDHYRFVAFDGESLTKDDKIEYGDFWSTGITELSLIIPDLLVPKGQSIKEISGVTMNNDMNFYVSVVLTGSNSIKQYNSNVNDPVSVPWADKYDYKSDINQSMVSGAFDDIGFWQWLSQDGNQLNFNKKTYGLTYSKIFTVNTCSAYLGYVGVATDPYAAIPNSRQMIYAVDANCNSLTCGDGTKDAGEECDLGVNNGKTGFACDTSCKNTTAPPTGGSGKLKIITGFSPDLSPFPNSLMVEIANSSGVPVGNYPLTGNETTIPPDLPEGLYYVVFPSLAGYATPEPDSDVSNDDFKNTNPVPTDVNQGRRVYVVGGAVPTVMNVTYRKQSFLKQIGRTTAENLLYNGSNAGWQLLRGVAEISTDGVNWQKSIAEVLYVGEMSQAFIDKYPSNGNQYATAGSDIVYYIDFQTLGEAGKFYSASITDVILMTPIAGVNKINVVSAEPDYGEFTTSTYFPATCSGMKIPSGQATPIIGSPDPATGKINVTYNLVNIAFNCPFRVKLTIRVADDISTNLTISDTVTITANGAIKSDTYETSVMPAPYAQEASGGDIYARGGINLGPNGGAMYVIGAKGNVESTSEQDWILNSYVQRQGSTTDFDPNTCDSKNTVCGAMKENIRKMELRYTEKINNNVSNNYRFDANNPDGDVWYYNGLGAGDTIELSLGDIENKGTILVKNADVRITGDIIKRDPGSKNILGIIVYNGNVIIDPSVKQVDAVFYIYSDNSSINKGSFITKSESESGGTDTTQLVINGLVVSSGYSEGGLRKGAFQLNRNYVGNPKSIPFLSEPAELFNYDGSIIVNPPPGFREM